MDFTDDACIAILDSNRTWYRGVHDLHRYDTSGGSLNSWSPKCFNLQFFAFCNANQSCNFHKSRKIRVFCHYVKVQCFMHVTMNSFRCEQQILNCFYNSSQCMRIKFSIATYCGRSLINLSDFKANTTVIDNC